MKKKKEPYPTLFKRTDKPRTKAQLKEMRDKVIALSQKNNDKKQSSDEEDKPMTKKTGSEPDKKRSRKSLSDEEIIGMVKEWDDKTIGDWAKELGVSYQTILKMSKAIHKKDKNFCPPKKRKVKTIEERADDILSIIKKEQSKK